MCICGNGIVMLPKFMADFLIESHTKIQELKRSLLEVNLNDFKDRDHYELVRYRIHSELAQERSRNKSDIQDGLDAARVCLGIPEIVEFKKERCNWLVMDTVEEKN